MKRDELEQTYVDHVTKKILGDPYRNELAVRSMLHHRAGDYTNEELQAALVAEGFQTPKCRWRLIVSNGLRTKAEVVEFAFESEVEEYALMTYQGYDVLSIKEA
jgi:hypothetical protein